VTLVDAGPLVALIDRSDADHRRCVEVLDEISPPLLTTWPAFTEACYLLGNRAGWAGQDALWRMAARDDLLIADLTPPLRQRSRDLMEKYRDTPMDLADATLVAIAEQRRLRRVFTLDRDFSVYRLRGRRSFDVFP
jgi:hypothetical protein